MNAINSYIIDIIEGLRTFLFWGGAIALLVGAFSFVLAMWDCESGIKEEIATGRQIRQMIIPELRRQEISRTDLESLLKEIPEGESAVEEFYEFCSAIPKRLVLLGVIAILIGTLLPSQATISVWLS